MSSPTDTSSSPTGFLHLPPELRNRIYELVIDDVPSPVVLNDIRIPPLARVSRHIRQEFYPLFLAKTRIIVLIGAEFDTIVFRVQVSPSGKYECIREPQSQITQNSGRIVFPPLALPQGALFRNIEFDVTRGDLLHLCLEAARKRTRWNGLSFCTLALSYTPKDGPKVESCFNGRSVGYERADVEALVNLAAGKAKDISKRDGFKGFTLKDLEEVAAMFRHDSKMQRIWSGLCSNTSIVLRTFLALGGP